MSQPTRVRIEGDDAGRQEPATEDQAEHEHGRAERAQERAERRAGHVHARRRARRGRPPAGPATRRRRCRGRRSRSASASQYSRVSVRAMAPRARTARRRPAPGRAGTRRSPRRPGDTTARACGCRPACAAPGAACRDGPAGAARRRRKVQMRMTTTTTRMTIGRSAMIAPQSGMTNCAVRSRMLVQRSSSIAGRRPPGQSFGEPATST